MDILHFIIRVDVVNDRMSIKIDAFSYLCTMRQAGGSIFSITYPTPTYHHVA
jgi:hypothetical protein